MAEGDNVVTLDNEFPSNAYPWMNLASRGVDTRRVPTDRGRVDLARVEAACDRRTRIIAISWVGYLSGWQSNLDAFVELARRHRALLFVDAIQGLGVFPLDVKATPIDFLAADGHKWLLGPEGAGLFYLRREHLNLLRPIGVGWHSVEHATDYGHIELKLKASRRSLRRGDAKHVGFSGPRREFAIPVGRRPDRDRPAQLLDITDLAVERCAAREPWSSVSVKVSIVRAS